MTDDPRSVEEKQTAMVATALISKRANASIEPLSPVNAAAFLGTIDSYHTGQGSYNLLVPKAKIRDFDLNADLWDRVGGHGKERVIKGRAYYDIDAMTGTELIGRLEVLCGKTWQETRGLKASVDSTKQPRKIA